MKTAVILHGTCDRDEYFDSRYPAPSNSHWLPWLQKQLIMQGYAADTPEVPQSWQPDYKIWAETFTRHTLTPDSLVIGHSCGAGFLLRWLSENPVAIKRLVLVAPWLDPDRAKTNDFFDFAIDSGLTQRFEVHLLHSDNDDPDINQSVTIIRSALPDIHYHAFSGQGHFTFADMKTIEFPVLRDITLGL